MKLKTVNSCLRPPSDWLQIKVKVMLRPTISWLICLGVKLHVGPKARFLSLSDSCGYVDVGCPLWREDGFFTTVAVHHQRSHSQVWFRRDSWPYFTISDSGGQIPVFISLRNRLAQLYSQALDSLFHRLLLFAGLRWRYWNPSSHGRLTLTVDSKSESKSKLLYDWRFTTHQFVLASNSLRLTTRDFFPPTEPLRL
jgi:hypothetical protein